MSEEGKSTKYRSQESYNERMSKAGFVKVGAWIPECERENFLDHAYALRLKFARVNGFDLSKV